MIDLELIEATVPLGGALVALAEIYVDESGTHVGSPFLCVAGYVFMRRRALEFAKKHSGDLARAGIPYFHAKECNPDPGFGPFANLTKPERIAVQKRIITRTRDLSSFGFALTVREAEYEAVRSQLALDVSAYSFLLWSTLSAVHRWMERTHFEGRAAYIFEAGHDSQSEANRIMAMIHSNDLLREKYRMSHFGFSNRRDYLPLQAADLFAWHWFTDCKKQDAGLKRRADCAALIRPEIDRAAHYPRDELLKHLSRPMTAV